MPLSDRRLLDSLSRMSFIDTAELAGYPRRGPRNGPPSPDRPTSRRHRREGESRHRPTPFEPEIRPDGQWHRRRCRVPRIRDAFELRARLPCVQRVAAVYRLASSLPPGTGSRRSHVEFHRRGRFDATITLHAGRSLYDRLRAIAGYDYTLKLTAAPGGLSGFSVTLVLGAQGVTEITGVEFPDFGLTSAIPDVFPAQQVRLSAADLSQAVGPGSTEATLATIRIRGVGTGTSVLNTVVHAIDDDSGAPIPVTPRPTTLIVS